MIQTFSLKPLPHIHFGHRNLQKLPTLAASFGHRLLILTGGKSLSKTTHWQELNNRLAGSEFHCFFGAIRDEPCPNDIDILVRHHVHEQIDVVIAIGGGSVLDAGKAISAMLPMGEPVRQFLEGVGDRRPDGTKIPFIAVPTTSGTGSEATSNAVISQPGTDGFKKSLRHDRFVPDIALIDPDLMISCPADLSASCGMDTFTQLVEAFLSTKASPMTDSLAWSGIEAVRRSLLKSCRDGSDKTARADMAYASLCSGIVLTNVGLGVVHGMAPPLGSLFSIPHGIVCGTLMAAANRVTLKHLEQLEKEQPALEKYSRLGRLFCRKNDRSDHFYRQSFIERLFELTEQLALPKLHRFNVVPEDIPKIAARTGLKNNPATLSEDEVTEILNQCL